MQGLRNVNGQEVVLNYSRSAARARKFASEWGIPESTANLEKAVARDDIDLFVIALPNQAHLDVSLALSRARRNQVCTQLRLLICSQQPVGRVRAGTAPPECPGVITRPIEAERRADECGLCRRGHLTVTDVHHGFFRE